MTGDLSPKAARTGLLGRAAKQFVSFLANRRGNTAMIYALTLTPIITLLGGAVDDAFVGLVGYKIGHVIT